MKKKKTQKAPKKSHKIMPLGDRVLVRPFTEDEVKGGNKNHYGILLPDTISKEKSAQGKVLAVGIGKLKDGKHVAIQVKVGDTVIFSKYSYDEVEQGEEMLYLLKEENILAIIN